MAVLTQEQYEQLRARVVGLVDPLLIGRQLLSPLPVDIGTQEFGYDKLGDMTDAEIISKFAPGSKDMYTVARHTDNIEIMHKGFQVSRIDLLSSQRTGQSIKAIGLERAARKVAELEDNVIFNGNVEYGIDGMEQIFGNTSAAGQTWDNPATETLNPYDDILEARNELTTDGFYPKFLVLNPLEYGRALKKLPGQTGTWMDMIKTIVPNVLESKTVASGTGWMGDIGADISELVIAESYNMLDPNVADQMVYGFDVINRVLPGGVCS